MYVYSDQDGNILRVSRSLNELSPLNVISVSHSAFPSLRDHPERYMVVAGRVVQRPYLEVSSSTSVDSSGEEQLSLSATLVNSAASAQADMGVVVGSTSFSVPFVSGTASLSVSVHPSLDGFSCQMVLSASGAVDVPISLTNGSEETTIQAVPMGGNSYLVAPTSKSVLRAFYSGILNARSAQDTLSRSLQNLYLVDSITLHALITRVISSLTQSSYTPISLSADEQNAISDMNQNLIPNFGLHLGTIFPVGGERVEQYQSAIDQAPLVLFAARSYAEDVAKIPNLV